MQIIILNLYIIIVWLGNDIKVTGGGAYKYAELIEKKLGLKIAKALFSAIIFICIFRINNLVSPLHVPKEYLEDKVRV